MGLKGGRLQLSNTIYFTQWDNQIFTVGIERFNRSACRCSCLFRRSGWWFHFFLVLTLVWLLRIVEIYHPSIGFCAADSRKGKVNLLRNSGGMRRFAEELMLHRQV